MQTEPDKRTFPARVLVVDDDTDILELVKLLLEDAGFAVETANCGQAAIDRLRLEKIARLDVVVLDINMPDVDGFKVAGEIRALQHCRRTQIAFHTAMSEDWVRESFDHFDDFLSKPLAGAELVERIGRLARTT